MIRLYKLIVVLVCLFMSYQIFAETKRCLYVENSINFHAELMKSSGQDIGYHPLLGQA